MMKIRTMAKASMIGLLALVFLPSAVGFLPLTPASQSWRHDVGVDKKHNRKQGLPSPVQKSQEERMVPTIAFAKVRSAVIQDQVKNVSAARVFSGKRAQRLKDILLDRELRNDITQAEFVLNLDIPSTQPNPNAVGYIDYEKLADKLEKNLEVIDKRRMRIVASGNSDEISDLTKRLNATKKELEFVLTRVRNSLDKSAAPQPTEPAPESESTNDEGDNFNPFTVFVREDGSVDWDGAIQSGRDLARFGGEVFERLQGKGPGEEEGKRAANMSAIDSSPQIRALLTSLEELEKKLDEAENEWDKILKEQLSLRDQGAALARTTKSDLRMAEEQVVELRRRVKLQKLDIDMERICAYIEQEIQQSTSPREQKLLVAEFGLLDAQLTTLITMLQDSEFDPTSLIDLDENELAVVTSEVQDLKSRLGLVEDPGVRFEWSQIQVAIRDSIDKIKNGVNFYVKGTKILAADLQYAAWLVGRAAQGYTLKPREVRTLWRTAKDILTLIPFTIILIIPMTPIGHVLVFSLIQRIFPDFFPSTFTDRRQNLSKMYDEIEKKPFGDLTNNQ